MLVISYTFNDHLGDNSHTGHQAQECRRFKETWERNVCQWGEGRSHGFFLKNPATTNDFEVIQNSFQVGF